MSEQNIKKTKDANFSSWLFSCVIGPIIIGGIIYGVIIYSEVKTPFFSTLGAGDLISIAAMMLIAVHIEIKNISIPNSTKKDDLYKDAVLWGPMFLWLLYGLIKFICIKHIPEAEKTADQYLAKTVISILGITIFICAVVLSIYCRSLYLERKIND